MPVKFCPISSGSCGNCVYVGTPGTHILIDAGLSAKRIERGLQKIGVSGEQISAIFVTHEHADHVLGVGILARRYHMPVYATENTWRFLWRHGTIGLVPENLIKIIEPGLRFSINDFEGAAFDIPHDASQPVGYCIYAGSHKITVATDIGCVTDCVRQNIAGSSILLLESNHDLEMLRNGRYPQVLKDRIMSSRGHLSNASAGLLLSESVSEKLRYVYLGHLSEENNRPLIALDTVENILLAHHIRPGVDVKLMIADRGGLSEAVELA
jgi:phosphoribosyl 1,2-cyclic phosphodiesterase